jgi:hypothetical protein
MGESIVIELKNGWISVKDRLPEEKENPITRDYYEYPVIMKFLNEKRDIRYQKFGRGHWWSCGSCIDKYVTHWMDLTELPPEESK